MKIWNLRTSQYAAVRLVRTFKLHIAFLILLLNLFFFSLGHNEHHTKCGFIRYWSCVEVRLQHMINQRWKLLQIFTIWQSLAGLQFSASEKMKIVIFLQRFRVTFNMRTLYKRSNFSANLFWKKNVPHNLQLSLIRS